MKEICNIIACGNEVKNFDLSTLKGDVMVINGAITLYPNAKYFIALDAIVFERYDKWLKDFKGIKFNDRQITRTTQIPQYPKVNLTGYSAIRTAQELGYKTINLIGFGAKGTGDAFGFNELTEAVHKQMIEACKDMKLNFLTKSAINGTL